MRAQDPAVSASDTANRPGAMVTVQLESKLGLGPSEHRRSKPKEDDPTPDKRARIRRQMQSR
jgi:hypothetical protein